MSPSGPEPLFRSGPDRMMKKRPADHARSENLAAEYVDGELTIRLPVKA